MKLWCKRWPTWLWFWKLADRKFISRKETWWLCLYLSSDCYNKLSWTSELNSECLFLTVLKARNLEVRVPSEFWWGSSSWFRELPFHGSSYKGIDPIRTVHLHNLITSQRPHFQMLSHGVWDFNMETLKTHIQFVPFYLWKLACSYGIILTLHRVVFGCFRKDSLQRRQDLPGSSLGIFFYFCLQCFSILFTV